MPTVPHDVIVIGGGPAGSACARLLASWGRRVLVLARPIDRWRGLAESIPPSARKLLTALELLDAVAAAGFPANRGNAVWWGATEGRMEDFGETGTAGFQVFRPDFDELLAREAVRAGVEWRECAVRAVNFVDEEAIVEYDADDGRAEARARFAIDCSGRTGVIARRGFRVYEPNHRMQAYLGMWRRHEGLPGADDRTIVETYEDGWAWSVAISTTVRQVAVMVDAATTRTKKGGPIAHAYRAELAKTRQLQRVVADASLDHVWACDASLYSATQFAGSRFLLAGDAAACIDPLSSYGVKKALGSAWMAAVALNTALTDPPRQALAFDFFAAREREVYAADLARTRAYAQHAWLHHRHPFWDARRGSARETPGLPRDEQLLQAPAVMAAHQRLRNLPAAELRWGGNIRFEPRPVIRGREVVLEDAVALGGATLRFAAGIDLRCVLELALRYRQVPDLYDAYCAARGPVALAPFLAAVSLLLAQHVLEARSSDVA